MSKYIPDIFAKIPQRSQKEFVCTDSVTGITKAALTMHITLVSTGIIVKNSTPVAKSFSVVSNVPPVRPAIKYARTLSKNVAIDSTKHLMCATAINHCSIAHKYR